MSTTGESDLEWFWRVVLDELDAILDRKAASAGRVYGPKARAAGREAMRAAIAKHLKPNAGALAGLRALGEHAVRSTIQRWIEPAHRRPS